MAKRRTGPGRARRDGRKTLQLCKQVSRALSYGFSECDDDVIRELFVQAVEPAPDASRLLVTVCPLGEEQDLATVMTHLGHATPFLRGAVANAIHRKRTPELNFRYAPRIEPSDEQE